MTSDRVLPIPLQGMLSRKTKKEQVTCETESMNRYVVNSMARSQSPLPGLFDAQDYDRVISFFRSVKAYQPTPLRNLPALACELNIRQLLIKDESARMGMNSFKILGVLYAIRRLLDEGLLAKDTVLVTATDGNHGLAVAHIAREQGLSARIYVHARTTTARTDAIRRAGAHVVIIDGNYDDAVSQAARDADRHGWAVISDTSWPGYEQVPRKIMEGYTILLEEASAQWESNLPPDIVLVQVGVGGLLCAVVSWLCHRYGAKRPFVIACEPNAAACLLESARASKPVVLQGTLDTIMAGLSSGRVSYLTWPTLAATVDAFVAIDDECSEFAMRRLARPRGSDPVVVAGESGACGVAALWAILKDETLGPVRDASGLSPESRVLVFNTEGATDPESYRRIVQGED